MVCGRGHHPYRRSIMAVARQQEKEEVSFVTEKVAPANIQNSITATGSIEPVTEVTVGTQVSGIISKIYVDYNSEVKKGRLSPSWTRPTSSAR